MHRVATYSSPVEAMTAVMFLWRHGVPAGAFMPRGQSASITPTHASAGRGMGVYDVMLADGVLLERARALLADMHAEPATFDPEWEHASETPDLQRVDPSLAPACPSCGRTLAMDALLTKCRSCRSPVNVVELLLAAHGPEILADAYDATPTLPADVLKEAPVPCPSCGYSLAGLDLEGDCPECGEGFRKVDIVRLWFG